MNKPGTLNLHILYQDDHWTDVHGSDIPLEQIDARYATNIIRFLERRAERFYAMWALHLAAEIDFDLSDGVFNALTSGLNQHEQTLPLDWLRSTKLYKAILVRSLATPEVHEGGLPARFRQLRHSL